MLVVVQLVQVASVWWHLLYGTRLGLYLSSLFRQVVEIVPQVKFPLEDYHFRDLAGALNFTYIPVAQQAMAQLGDCTLVNK